MHYFLAKEAHIFKFSARETPVLRISSGDRLNFETLDCFSNQIQNPGDRLEDVSFDRVNPATGPVYVEGARKGDALKVSIEQIRIGDQAVMLTGKDFGVLGHMMGELYFKILPIENGTVVFDGQTRLPVKPMVGVIGVAPEEGEISCGTPGAHGGNMDTTLIREKADVYLPVSVEGGLLALGDLHALMGDGEVAVSGAEVAGEVMVKVTLIKDLYLPTPLVINDRVLAVIFSHEKLDDAVTGAVEIMYDLLESRIGLPTPENVMLLSLAGQVRICQVVDPLKTVRCEIPLEVLNNYGFKLY